MTLSSYKTIVFDLDGTLLDTWPSLLESVRAIASDSIALEPATLRAALSQGLDPMFAQAAQQMPPGARQAQPIIQNMQRYYFDHALSGAIPFGYIDQMLRQLIETGYTLAVCTNRDRSSTLTLLDLHGWTPLFSHIQCLDDGQPPKPDPAPLLTTLSHLNCAVQDALFVGDSWADAKCATLGQVDFAAHLGGYHTDPNDLTPNVMSYHHARELTQQLTQPLSFLLEIEND